MNELYPAQRMRHGRSKDKIEEYLVWNGMLQRCYNPNRSNYRFYGRRGVRVHVRWHDPKNFAEDMGARPSGKHTIDRWPGKSGHYGPGNCRWATKHQQANNCRNNLRHTYKGETKTIPEWSRAFQRNPRAVRQRVEVYGWNLEKALLTPTNDWAPIRRQKRGVVK